MDSSTARSTGPAAANSRYDGIDGIPSFVQVGVLDRDEIMLMRSTTKFPTLSLAAFGNMPVLIDRFESLPHSLQDGQAPDGHAQGWRPSQANFSKYVYSRFC